MLTVEGDFGVCCVYGQLHCRVHLNALGFINLCSLEGRAHWKESEFQCK